MCHHCLRDRVGREVVVKQLPDHISNTYVVSSAGVNGVDQFHFVGAGVSTIGWRDGEAMVGTPGSSP